MGFVSGFIVGSFVTGFVLMMCYGRKINSHKPARKAGTKIEVLGSVSNGQGDYIICQCPTKFERPLYTEDIILSTSPRIAPYIS